MGIYHDILQPHCVSLYRVIFPLHLSNSIQFNLYRCIMMYLYIYLLVCLSASIYIPIYVFLHLSTSLYIWLYSYIQYLYHIILYLYKALSCSICHPRPIFNGLPISPGIRSSGSAFKMPPLLWRDVEEPTRAVHRCRCWMATQRLAT